MEAIRQTFVVHVLGRGAAVVVEDVATREKVSVADVRTVGEHIAQRLTLRREEGER
jgi:hypothetical protein